MGVEKEIRVPDIGDFDSVEVIEVLVSSGDSIQREDSLITIESDKASMEIPSPYSGVVGKIAVAVGDRVSQDSLIGQGSETLADLLRKTADRLPAEEAKALGQLN